MFFSAVECGHPFGDGEVSDEYFLKGGELFGCCFHDFAGCLNGSDFGAGMGGDPFAEGGYAVEDIVGLTADEELLGAVVFLLNAVGGGEGAPHQRYLQGIEGVSVEELDREGCHETGEEQGALVAAGGFVNFHS